MFLNFSILNNYTCRLIFHIFAGNLEDVVGFFARLAFGVVVDEGVVFVDYVAETFHFLFINALRSLLIAGFQDEHFELFLIFAVRVVFDGVLGNDDCRFVVVAHVVAKVVVELCVLKFLEYEFVLKLEDCILGYRHLVAFWEVVEDALKLFDSLLGVGLVELRLGGVEVVTISRVETGKLGVLTFGVIHIVGLEVGARTDIILVLVVAQSEQIE